MAQRRQVLLIVLLVVIVPAAGIGVTMLVAPQALMSLFMPPAAAPEPPLPAIKFTVDSTEIGAFLDHPVARKWLDRHFPGFRDADQVELARRLTLPQVQPFFPDIITSQALAALKAELDPLPPLQPIIVYSTAQTELGTLLDDAEARAIIDKRIPDFTKDSRLSMARPFTLAFLQLHIPDTVTDERLAAIDADFAALADARAEEMNHGGH